MAISFPALAATAAENDLRHLRGFVRDAQRRYEDQLTALEREWDERQPDDDLVEPERGWYEDTLVDERYLADQVQQLAAELVVVGLYRLVEVHTKRILKWRYEAACVDRWNARAIAGHLLNDGIDVEQFASAAAIDELRLLNNAIKHQGEVTPDLARYSGWNVGAKLIDLAEAFERLAPHGPSYLVQLAEAVIE